MEVISGVNNPRVKAAAELKQKKYREEKGLFLVEGLRAVEEAVAYGDVVSLFVISGEESERQKKVLQQAAEKGVALYQADDKIMHKICDTQTPQGVVAVVRMPKNDISRLNPSRKKYENNIPVVILDRIRDPGNLGTIIRTADAVGALGVILLAGSADVYSPKVVRASMGSIFHLPLAQGIEPEAALTWCMRYGYTTAAASLTAAEELYKVDLSRKMAFILGNEANGVTSELQAASDKRLYIPMPGKAESMNVAMAAGVILFESLRQRKYQAAFMDITEVTLTPEI